MNGICQPKVIIDGGLSFNLAVIRAMVEKGDRVIDTAQPAVIASAIKVGSAGNTGSAPSSEPKNTAIIIGLTPRNDTGIIISVRQDSKI